MRLDVVIPAHNEVARIGQTLEAYRTAIPEPDVTFHIAMDACTDATAEVVAAHRARDPRVVQHNYVKLGKGGVIIETFRRCRADHVAFVDADGATPPQELRRMVTMLSHFDVAVAGRRHVSAVLPRPKRMPRRLTSMAFARAVKMLFRLPVEDTQCGAKVMRRAVIERALPFLSSRDLVFDVDLLMVACDLGFTVVEVPTVWVDQDGSRIHLGRDTRLMAASLLRLWLHHRLMPVPARQPEVVRIFDVTEPEESRPIDVTRIADVAT